MFDVGFSELALIFGVSLVVLGPKRLPGLVTKVGRWVGKARAMATDFRRQLESEVNLEELNRMTELQSRGPRGSTMSEPPPPPPDPAPTYPYAAQEPTTDNSFAPASSPEEPLPDVAPVDDTYSHAHAADGAPMAEVPDENPVQADLDLSTHDDDSHLPPDDARRYS